MEGTAEVRRSKGSDKEQKQKGRKMSDSHPEYRMFDRWIEYPHTNTCLFLQKSHLFIH